MYYHCCPLKYVEYGKVVPHRDEESWILPAYEWLGHHCGYCSQIWLSRSKSNITGYRSSNTIKKSKYVISKRSNSKISNDSVLFGFDIIKGFPVSYDLWCAILTGLIQGKGFKKQNESIIDMMDWCVKGDKEDGIPHDSYVQDWVDSGRDLDVFLKKSLFKENDQVVVPTLNLKSAKKIVCSDEKQKKKLRKMGFIEDRIHIKNLKKYDW